MASPEAKQRSRNSLMFNVALPTHHVFSKKKSMQKLSDDVPTEPLNSPGASTSSNSGTPLPSPTGGAKLVKQARRFSQVIGDVILPSGSAVDNHTGGVKMIRHSESQLKSSGGRKRGLLGRKTTPLPESTAEAPQSPTKQLDNEEITLPKSPTNPDTNISQMLDGAPVPPPQPHHIQPIDAEPNSVANRPDFKCTLNATNPEAIQPVAETEMVSIFQTNQLERIPSQTKSVHTPGSSSNRNKRSQRTKKHIRRASFDTTMFSQLPDMPVDGAQLQKSAAPVKRSRSLWAKRTEVEPKDENVDIFDRGTPRNERHRSINVKRARKMTEVFGSEPPRALFQIAQTVQEEEFEDSERQRRVSVTTVHSMSRTNLLTIGTQYSARGRTISGASSNSAPPTPTTRTPQEETPEPAFIPVSNTMPFKAYAHPKHTIIPSNKTSDDEFRQRRLRIKKLQKFFGVRYQDLQQHIPDGGPPPVFDTSVQVAISGGAFWERAGSPTPEQEPNMEDVIRKLRGLKATT